LISGYLSFIVFRKLDAINPHPPVTNALGIL